MYEHAIPLEFGKQSFDALLTGRVRTPSLQVEFANCPLVHNQAVLAQSFLKAV
ncbi:hypothetical protein D3C85_1596310 [compost metagenome]